MLNIINVLTIFNIWRTFVMYKSLRKMKAVDRRAYLMKEVYGVLNRAKKASRFLSEEQIARLRQAEEYLEKADKSANSFSVVNRMVSKEAIAETFEYIQHAREIAKQIDEEAAAIAKELEDI